MHRFYGYGYGYCYCYCLGSVLRNKLQLSGFKAETRNVMPMDHVPSEQRFSRNRRKTLQPSNHRIPICRKNQAPSDKYHQQKQGDCIICLDPDYTPIFRLHTHPLPTPTFRKLPLTWSCHFASSQKSRTRRAGHPSDR